MAPKKGAVDLTSPESVALITLFQSTGLSESRARNTVQSTKASTAYSRLVDEANLARGDIKLDEKKAGLCADLAAACGYEAGKDKLRKEEVGYVVEAIKDGRLKSTDQVSGQSLRTGRLFYRGPDLLLDSCCDLPRDDPGLSPRRYQPCRQRCL